MSTGVTDTSASGLSESWMQVNSARLLVGDWRDGVGRLEAESVDLVYADPPFMTGKRQSDRAGAFDDAWDDRASYLRWLGDCLGATLPALKPTGSILIHVDWRTSHHVRLLLDELLGEDRFVNHLVWRYGLGGSSPRRFARKHDDILFYAKGPERYWFEPPMVAATSRRMAGQMKKATDVLDVPAINNQATERVGWPTQKPLALLEMLIGACCPPCGTVLDPCCGSGTTLVAAQKLGRSAIGIDVSEQAIEITRERLENAR